MPEDDDKLERDLQRLEIDFEKSTPWAAWEYRDVVFPAPNQQVTVRHRIQPVGPIGVLAVHWRLPEIPSIGPALYTLKEESLQFPGYLRVRSTVAGEATLLIGLRRAR